MKPKLGKTYIEKRKYFKNRAVVVRGFANQDRDVFGTQWDLKTLHVSTFKMRVDTFRKTFEPSPMQLSRLFLRRVRYIIKESE